MQEKIKLAAETLNSAVLAYTLRELTDGEFIEAVCGVAELLNLLQRGRQDDRSMH